MATQTGSIDLTASNSVKLAAEAGWQSDLEDYYTKSEIDVTVGGINSTVSSKVGENEVISTINQSAESVSIDASKINLTGAVTISDLASDAQNATLNSNISVGGRNLLTGSGDWSNISTSSTNPGTVSGDTFTFSSHSSLAWYGVHISYPHMPFSDVDGKTLTLSFDYRSDDFSDTSGDHYIYINAAASATIDGGRSKYRQISTSAFDGVYVPTTTWQRGSITFDLSESLLTSGSGACNYFFIQFYNHTLNSLQLRHVKLEVGNISTDWTPAPEDVDAAITNAAKTATSYVTEITGQNGIMVHPSTDDDTGVRITSDVDILRDGYSVINVGTRGDTSGNTDAGVTIYDGSGDSPSNAVVTFTGKVDSAGRRRSYIDTGDPTDGSSAAKVIGTVEDTDYGSYVLRKREMELFAYAPNGTDSGSVSAWAQTSTDGTFDESGVALYGKWLNLNHELSYISVPMEQAGAMLSVDSATLTRGSGASSWSDGTVRRSGKVVTMTINGAKLASALASGSTSGTITTIPTGYRPANLQRGVACIGTTGDYANVWFVASNTGNVAIANRSPLSIPTTAEIHMQITYIID